MSTITLRADRSAVKTLPFAALPHHVASDPRLTPVDVRVVTALLFWARDKASCWPCDRSIGSRVGRSVQTVQRALRRLQGLGVIDREKVEPSDANRTGRIIRLRWRCATRCATTTTLCNTLCNGRVTPRSPVSDPPRSSVSDEGIENERERERPSSDSGSGSPPPPAGEGEQNDVAELIALAEGGGPFAGVARKRLAELPPLPSPAPTEDVPVEADCTRIPAVIAHSEATIAHFAATQVREPVVPQPPRPAPAQVPDRVGPTMRKPPATQRGVYGGVSLLGDALKWPLNHAHARPAPPRRPAGP